MDTATGDTEDFGLWLEATGVGWLFASPPTPSSGLSTDGSGPMNFINGARTDSGVEQLDELSANDQVITNIEDLPTELLAIILYYAIQIPRSGLMRLQELSTVCSRWRDAVKGTPKLWSRVTDEDPLHLFDRAMNESKDAPLDIDIEDGLWKRQEPEELERRMRIVCAHMKRWRHASIDVRNASEWLFKAVAAPIAPRLETLKLKLHNDSRSSIAIFQRATLPLLQELDICGLPLEDGIGTFSNLRILKIQISNASQPSLSEVITLLRSLQRLEKFCFTGALQSLNDDNNPGATPYQPLTLPRLKRLFVLTGKSKGFLQISSCLRAPVCQELALSGDPFRDDDPLHPSTTLREGVCHFIPAIHSNWVLGGRVEIVAETAWSRLRAPRLMLNFGSANPRYRMHSAEIPHWIIENFPRKDAEITLDVRLTGSLAEQLVTLVSLGPPVYITTLNLSKADDGGSSVIQHLSKPAPALDKPSQWPLPHMSSLTVSCYRGCLASLLDMLRARVAGAGDSDVAQPVSLKKLEIKGYGRKRAGGRVLQLELERLMRETGGSLSCSESWRSTS
ncbi:hypothetical protein FRC01_011379 [Tulasnella sp. 417]|nr:hypothetical protein FRC01_011379 [Tulasnella sp. 417]